MLRFVTEINDLVLLKYQTLFRQPTFEECKEIMLERIERPCHLAGPFLIVAPALLRRPDYRRAAAFLLQISCSERVEHFLDLLCAPDNHLVDEGVLGDINAMD